MTPEQIYALLPQSQLTGIYQLPSDGVDALRQAAQSLGLACFTIDFSESGNLAAALKTLGDGLGFPDWYGANLDALNDCLTDFSWNEAPGYVLILSGADASHALRKPFVKTNRVLDNAILEWREQDIPFWVFYERRAGNLAGLPTLA
jgi:RNAse (barnase) inhibitor barstar